MGIIRLLTVQLMFAIIRMTRQAGADHFERKVSMTPSYFIGTTSYAREMPALIATASDRRVALIRLISVVVCLVVFDAAFSRKFTWCRSIPTARTHPSRYTEYVRISGAHIHSDIRTTIPKVCKFIWRNGSAGYFWKINRLVREQIPTVFSVSGVG
jgi:hypothetical protein